MKTKRKAAALLAAAALALSLALSACGSSDVSYKDGTYTGQSSVYINDDGTDEGNGYGVVEITIEDGKIVDATYQTYEEDGTLKGEDYGKIDGSVSNRDYYNKAQKAVAAASEYAKMLVENGSLDGIDAISGATVNYNNFVEAVNNALDQAKE